MGRASRSKKEQAPIPAPAKQAAITLSPEHYFRLVSLAKDVSLATHQAEQQIAAVRRLEAARNAYMAELQQQYPDLDVTGVVYSADDATCTLTPTSIKGDR